MTSVHKKTLKIGRLDRVDTLSYDRPKAAYVDHSVLPQRRKLYINLSRLNDKTYMSRYNLELSHSARTSKEDTVSCSWQHAVRTATASNEAISSSSRQQATDSAESSSDLLTIRSIKACLYLQHC